MTSTTLIRKVPVLLAEQTSKDESARSIPPSTNGKSKEGETRTAATGAEQPGRVDKGNRSMEATKPVLAIICHAAPDDAVGRHMSKTIEALALRKTTVHLFSRHDYRFSTSGVTVHAVGDPEGDLIEAVQEFGKRACNAFLKTFPTGCPNMAVLGYEWSSVPALSILRGLKNLPGLLSLHSLERQRSDMSSDLSKHIEEAEKLGLGQARTVLIQEPATAEIAKYWVPECADRLVNARQPFPVQDFETVVDPGQVKGRYQVGPVDPTIVFIGDLEERYGPDMLLKAMPALLRNNKQVRLIVVGDGSLYWPLRVYARYLLLEHAVRLVGSVQGQALNELIQAADVVAVPSRESTPWWPILGGWAARRPVVASHQAAPALLDGQHDSVLCYPIENSCVWGIERVLFDPAHGQAVAAGGRNKLEERFGWNSVAAQVEELMPVKAAR